MRSLGDLRRLLNQPFSGIADTMAALLWRQIVEFRPDTRFVVVRRPLDDVIASCYALGVRGSPFMFGEVMKALDEISAYPASITVQFDEIDHAAPTIYRHCLGVRPTPEYVDRMNGLRIEARMEDLVRRVEDNADGIRRLYGGILGRG